MRHSDGIKRVGGGAVNGDHENQHIDVMRLYHRDSEARDRANPGKSRQHVTAVYPV
ncbi:hypothetical protein D3C86_2029670 [compost metagenome]